MSTLPKLDTPEFDYGSVWEHTQPPHPDFTYGRKVEATPDGKIWVEEGERAGFKVVDTSKEDSMKLYQLMISGIVPRPVAFVSSVSESGVENLAPFSWFNMVTHNPPVVSVSVANVAGKPKDTAANVKATMGFTVNIMSEPFIENANACSADLPSDLSEWPMSGLTKAESILVKAPRVKESAFSMECELYEAIDIKRPDTGASTTTLLLGLVKYIHVRNDMLNERGNVDPSKYKVIGRMGDITYTRVQEGFRLARPAWSKDEELQNLYKESEVQAKNNL
ncbi:hypothetical protein CERSUDRAFT_87608 [Gelatoporia subvermispora B]|uniref:Flavin reductase like domain-containing protein n=1 Tax=Ceriporiopsis subvermispora (strain B) TaxID=914234 RepID=M2R3W2_CERS8|nr:hypothetical protein CERSUDRAFT_87608 [Gelatoporia subvermispora B]